MFTPVVRLLLAILAATMATKYFIQGNKESAVLVILAFTLIVSGYFRNGTVFLAFRQMKKNNIPKAKLLLEKVYRVSWLIKSQRAYYHFVRSFIAMSERKMDEAYVAMNLAVKTGLRTSNDKSIANLNLALIEFKRGNIAPSQEWIARTKEYNCSPRVLDELVKLQKRIGDSSANL